MDCTPFLVANSGDSSLPRVGVLYIILCCLLVLRPTESKKSVNSLSKALDKSRQIFNNMLQLCSLVLLERFEFFLRNWLLDFNWSAHCRQRQREISAFCIGL